MKTLSCKQAVELFSPMIDGCIDPGEKAMLLAHLNRCPQCAEEYAAWQNISAAMRQTPKVASPSPGFSQGVINSIREMESANREQAAFLNDQKTAGPLTGPNPGDKEQRRGMTGLFNTWRKQLVAAAAAVFILAGSLGINAGMKGFQVANGPDKSPDTRYVATGEENEKKITANTGGETDISEPTATDPEPEPNDANTGTDHGNSVDEEKNPADNNNSDRKAGNGEAGTTGVQETDTDANIQATTNEPQPVLLGSNMVIKSTVLKLAVNGTDQAIEKAGEIVAAAGGSINYLGVQDTGSGTVELLRVTAPKDTAVKLVNSLTGLGAVISRNDDDRNVTGQYNSLAARYNELVESAAGDPEAEAEMQSTKQELDRVAADAKMYTVVLWLQHK